MEIKYEQLLPPQTLDDLADKLSWLSCHMADIATDMSFYFGMNENAKIHSQELMGAAAICRKWAFALRDKESEKKTSKKTIKKIEKTRK